LTIAVSMTPLSWAQSSGQDAFNSLLQQGFQLHEQARFSEAIPPLEHARSLKPQDYFVNLLLGIDLLRSGKAVEAVPRLEVAAHANPGEEFPEDYLGEAEASLGRYAQAAEAYQRAMQKGHGSEDALEAWAGFALERFRSIGEALRASASGIAAAHKLAKSSDNLTSAGPCAGPIPQLERALVAKHPKGSAPNQGAQTAYQLSICYALEAGKAEQVLQNIAENVAAVHRLRGDVLLRLKGDGAGAEAEYRQAIAARAGDPALLERLAEAQLKAGETDAAEQSAQAALVIDPHRREALRTLASLAMNDRDYERALPWLKQLAAESPGDRTVQVQLGKALAQNSDAQGALHWLEPSLAAGYPDEKGALHALLGAVYRKLGRTADAVKAETEARRLSDAFQAQSPQAAPTRPDAKQ
jgi:predicted Zn-dependent protease